MRLITLSLGLLIVALAVVGCRVEGEVDPHGASSIVAPR